MAGGDWDESCFSSIAVVLVVLVHYGKVMEMWLSCPKIVVLLSNQISFTSGGEMRFRTFDNRKSMTPVNITV